MKQQSEDYLTISQIEFIQEALDTENQKVLEKIIGFSDNLKNYLMWNFAFYDNLKLLKWLHKNGGTIDVNTTNLIIKKNNPDVFKWIFENVGFPPGSPEARA